MKREKLSVELSYDDAISQAVLKEKGDQFDRVVGRIVNSSSMVSYYSIPKVIAYTTGKGAVEVMTREMTVELAQFDVRGNCIVPGFIVLEETV